MKLKSEDPADGNQFARWVTVSSKGQVALPVAIRKKLKINIGERLLIIVRKDKDGINLIKSGKLGKVFDNFSK
ncbi:AbrB/MazE/SpoVT family DNA-binding domain-containing protein [Patescibacteria group bacterium]|nr:AbrB/MazE/SpoVT family DNA-binding domain-containing protein [Patescibacteria group bacterium]MCL5797968.1 AbrB/MazE/SpoVT family DNA-binding domain-containing protein [Patescibacteria group bacterium]